MKPHKHAKLIKSWADGAEIEWKHKFTNNWVGFDEQEHFWDDEHEYRIKPEPKPNLDQMRRNMTLEILAREMEYAFQNQSNLEGRVWANRLINFIRTGNYEDLTDGVSND